MGARAWLSLVLWLAAPAAAQAPACPPEPARSSIARTLRARAERTDAMEARVGGMIREQVSRYGDRLRLGNLGELIALDPRTEYAAIVREQREASYQLQVAEERACPSAEEGRQACLAALRATPLPGGRPHADDIDQLTAYHSAAFRKRAMGWMVFRGRLAQWASDLRAGAAEAERGPNLEGLRDRERGLSEQMTLVAQRDWSRPPTDQPLQREFDNFGVELLRARMELEEAREACLGF